MATGETAREHIANAMQILRNAASEATTPTIVSLLRSEYDAIVVRLNAAVELLKERPPP